MKELMTPAPANLQIAFRTSESNVSAALELLRLLRAPPISAEAVVLVWDGHSVLLALSFDFDSLASRLPDVDEVVPALIVVFGDAGIVVERVDPLPPVLVSHFATLGGSHVP